MSAPTRVVLITGAAGGIGHAVARHLADEGWTVAALDRSATPWEHSYEVDVADPGSVQAAVAQVEADLGRVDALLTSAGHYEVVPVDEVTPEQWHRMLRVHLGGTANLVRAVAPGMVARGSGSIVAVASELAIGGGDGESHYAAAKGAIIGLVRSLAVELAPAGVSVNAIAPGPTDTPMLAPDDVCRTPAYLASVPLRRIVTPQEIAVVAGHLLAAGTFFTGEVVSPNAGAVI